MKLKSPHILLASSNSQKMLTNIRHVIDTTAYIALEQEINKNVIGLFRLGEEHYMFAKSVSKHSWRQRISRIYYGAYNVRRAVQLSFDGTYSTDSTDHKNVGELPDHFPNINTYQRRLADLRDDRNLADYNHDASETDLLLSQNDAEQVVGRFIEDARTYLAKRGINV